MAIVVSPVANSQTFGTWLSTTNRLANLMSQNTVTADSSSGGSVTTGNSYVNGYFGAEFVYVANTLSGGNVSTGGVLTLLANVAVSNGTSNVLVVTANSTTANVRITANAISLISTGNVNVSGNTLVVSAANVLFSGANIQFSNSPLSGNVTFASNAVFESAAVIVANGSFGANGAVLYSNGTGMHWQVIPAVVGNSGITANADGIFVNANSGLLANSNGLYVVANSGLLANSSGVFVQANSGLLANSSGVFVNANSGLLANSNGLYVVANSGLLANSSGVFVQANSGLLANSNGLYVVANSGIVANATGVYVNAAYIATLDANSSLYSNSSFTNAFTVGTASYFVANGNLGVGNSAPAHKLRVEGDLSLTGAIRLGNSAVINSDRSFLYYGSKHNALGTGSGTIDIDLTLGNYVSATVNGTTTFTFSNPLISPLAIGFALELTDGGSATVNWPLSVKWPGGVAPTLTASGVDVLVFFTDDGGTNWRGVSSMLDSK